MNEIKEVIFAVSDLKKTCCMYKKFLAKKAIAAIQLRQTVSQLTARNKSVSVRFHDWHADFSGKACSRKCFGDFEEVVNVILRTNFCVLINTKFFCLPLVGFIFY